MNGLRLNFMFAALSSCVLILCACGDYADPCVPSLALVNAQSNESGQVTLPGFPDEADARYCKIDELPDEDRCGLDPLTDGAGFIVGHQLPRGDTLGGGIYQVSANDEPLVITIETPCGRQTRELVHDMSGLASATLIVPPGGGCGMTVTASIANDTQSCSFSWNDCDGLAERCETFEDDSSTETSETDTDTSSGTDTDTSSGTDTDTGSSETG